jgi:FlaA1/EpsC-like NDP-sugar epimerase
MRRFLHVLTKLSNKIWIKGAPLHKKGERLFVKILKGEAWLYHHVQKAQHWWRQKKRRYTEALSSPTSRHEEECSLFFLTDVFLLFFSLVCSAFCFETDFKEYSSGFLFKNMVVYTLTVAAYLILLPVPSRFWDSKPNVRLITALILGTTTYSGFLSFLGKIEQFSWYTLLFNVFISFFLMKIPRSLAVIFFKELPLWEIHKDHPLSAQIRPIFQPESLWKVLIIGALSDIDEFFHNQQFRHYPAFSPIALITLDASECGQQIFGVSIVGALDTLDNIIKTQNGAIQGLFVLADALQPIDLQQIEQIASDKNLPILTTRRRKPLKKKAQRRSRLS